MDLSPVTIHIAKSLRRVLLLPIVFGLCSSWGCSKGSMDGSSPANSSQGSSGNYQPPPFTGQDPNKGLDVRKLAADADSYAITYGSLSKSDIDTLKSYPLVIVHPYNANLTRDHIMAIKQGNGSNHPVVLCYISIGEDERTFQLTDAQMLADSRFTGDGSGPSVDPRGPNASGGSLVGLPPKGTPTNGGFASYYVNDNPRRLACPDDPPLGSPDRNNNFQARFVNAGDPLWYSTVYSMKMEPATHTPPGLKELLTEDYGRGLGCDGLFLDTVDTAAPNYYTTCSDGDHSSSEWTAKGFANFITKLRSDFPDKVILQNRGLFFFDPRRPQYAVTTRGVIDIGFFESYHLGNDSATNVSTFFQDNKYNSVPKLMAEANRADGFKVLSLGYGDGFSGNKPGMDIKTLLGQSIMGYNYLRDDIEEAMAVGFRHYITNAEVTLVNPFVNNYLAANNTTSDTKAPVWSSTYNDNYQDPVTAPSFISRSGVQKVEVLAPGNVRLSWDVALDMNKVSYVVYYRPTPFDFATAFRVPIIKPAMGVGTGYDHVWEAPNPNLALQSVYPYQMEIWGLQQGVEYGFAIRAIDSKGNEDTNQVFMTATP